MAREERSFTSNVFNIVGASGCEFLADGVQSQLIA